MPRSKKPLTPDQILAAAAVDVLVKAEAVATRLVFRTAAEARREAKDRKVARRQKWGQVKTRLKPEEGE